MARSSVCPLNQQQLRVQQQSRQSNILILGGTSEASALALALIGKLQATLSLAGRTQTPRQPVPFRTGGFGGVEGLMGYLKVQNITAVVDATHPFASQMSRHAALACAGLQIPLVQLSRPAWQQQPGDLWQEVDTVAEAVAALPAAPKRIFLTHGRLDLAQFVRAPRHFYLIRTIDPPSGLAELAEAGISHRLILARGPFAQAEEAALLDSEHIDILITKNSGGTATYGKIAAARAAHIPVILLRRPKAEACRQASSVDEVLRWLHDLTP